MVYLVKNWFLYEPGDEVVSLNSGKRGRVVNSKKVDLQQKHQLVDILFRNGVMEDVNTGSIELLRRTSSSVFTAQSRSSLAS